MSDPVLSDIGKSCGTLHVLQDIKLEVKPGEFVAFIGPSGSGKSALLRIIAGLDSPTTGDMRIGGADRGSAWWTNQSRGRSTCAVRCTAEPDCRGVHRFSEDEFP